MGVIPEVSTATATVEVEARPRFNEPSLHAEIMRLRVVDNVTNLGYLAWEYVCLAAVIGGAIGFCEHRQAWGLPWALNVPVVAVAVVLIGGLLHRLAGLGHEASHFTLLRSKVLNDLVGDVFCMFPVLATVHFYRVFHMAHHQYTNDPARDPDIVALGGSKLLDRFPMSRWAFIKAFYLRVFTAPMAFVRYLGDYSRINVLGNSPNVYLRPSPAWPRLGATLGLLYVIADIAGQWGITTAGLPARWLVHEGLMGTLLILVVGALLPERAYFPTPFRQPYSPRVSGGLRLLYYTWLLVALGLLRVATGGRSTLYFGLFWVLPYLTTFAFFMLLRDVYQHTNADAGRLSNSRVFFADPLTRWAVFVYGQGMHIPHHLFPAIPHYRLERLHRLLKRRHAEYAAQVVECHGTFANRGGGPTILDVLTEPRS
jgi:fatty acid desaturase